MSTSESEPTFSSAEAFATLRETCSGSDIDCREAQLIRLGENAIFRLESQGTIVRIGRNLQALKDAKKEVAVASWLNDAGIAAASSIVQMQPIVVRGKPVTFWHLIEDSGVKASLGDLAGILLKLHHLPVPESLHLPAFEIFGQVGGRLGAASTVSADDKHFLTGRLHELEEAYSTLRFKLPPAAVHGDAHQGNLIRKPDGSAVLIDLERFAFGPPEADLAMTATEYLVGFHSDSSYHEFANAYGFDILSWDDFPVLRAIHELKMTTWLMQNVGESDAIAQEFGNRLMSLHDDNSTRNWQPF